MTAPTLPAPAARPTLRPGARASLAERGRPAPSEWVQLLPLRPLGWACLAIGVLGLGIGLPTRWWELRLVGVFALVLVGLALAFTLGRPRYRVGLGLDADRVPVGDPAGGSLSVHNAGARRSLPARLDLPIGEATASFTLPSLAPGAERAEGFTIPTTRRGVVLVGPPQSIQGDPFSLAGRVTRWTEGARLFVHPRTVALPGRQAGFVHDLEGQASQELSSSDMDFHALRQYVPGDDRRQVHWRSSARAGRLMVRQFAETRQSRVALALDISTSGYLDDEEFELAVSVAGSIGLQALREGNPLEVLTQFGALPSPHPSRLLDELSAVQRRAWSPAGTEQGAPGAEASAQRLVREALRRAPAASLLVLVSGSGLRAPQWSRVLASVPGEVRVVAVLAEPGAPVLVRSMGRVTTLTLPEMAELPRAMRRAMS